MKVIVTGGGTGGHIYPALAIAKALSARIPGADILYVGTTAGMEAKLVPANGLKFSGIPGKGLPRKLSVDLFKAAHSAVLAIWQTRRILKEFGPDLVVGTGGYVSGPVVLTAALAGIPTILHEQNALPGKTNKVLSRFVDKVILTFPGSQKYFRQPKKATVIGLPVRVEIGRIDRARGAKEFGLNPKKKTLLVTGGSRGALSINKAMAGLLATIKNDGDIQVIWAVGSATYQATIADLEQKGIAWKNDRWRIREYIDNMPEALACADLCVCRAGAATLAELSAAGRASILVPYPYAAENHQEYNARAFEDNGAASVILDKDLNADVLAEEVRKLMHSPYLLEEMGQKAKQVFEPEALQKIVELCVRTAWK